MKKKIISTKLAYILICIATITLLLIVGVLYNKSIMAKWEPDETIIGLWSGNGKSHIDLPSDNSEEYINTYTEVEIMIIIHEDGTVTGSVGDATLTECHITLNRTDFERSIHFKTDYIIKGQLQDAIVVGDAISYRDITIPFNIEDDTLKGSLFLIKGWEYPYPIVARLRLTNK